MPSPLQQIYTKKKSATQVMVSKITTQEAVQFIHHKNQPIMTIKFFRFLSLAALFSVALLSLVSSQKEPVTPEAKAATLHRQLAGQWEVSNLYMGDTDLTETMVTASTLTFNLLGEYSWLIRYASGASETQSGHCDIAADQQRLTLTTNRGDHLDMAVVCQGNALQLVGGLLDEPMVVKAERIKK